MRRNGKKNSHVGRRAGSHGGTELRPILIKRRFSLSSNLVFYSWDLSSVPPHEAYVRLTTSRMEVKDMIFH